MSSFVKVDPARLVIDGTDFSTTANTLNNALTAASSALSSTSGMAGDDDTAEEFAPEYDKGAQGVLDNVAGVVNMLRGFDANLQATARAYKQAEMIGAGHDPSGCSISKPDAMTAVTANSVPGSLGPGWPGPLGEFQEFLESALATIGVRIPTGDTGKLQSAADAWENLSYALIDANSALSGTLTGLSAMDIPQNATIQSSKSSIETFVRDVKTGSDALLGACVKFKQDIENMREELAAFLAQMAAEIALDIGITVALGVLTAGLGAAAGAGKIMLTVVKWANKIATLIRRLQELTRGTSMLMRVALRGIGEGIQSAISSTVVQAGVNAFGPESMHQSLWVTATTSFAGGAASSPVGRVFDRATPNFRPAVKDVASGAIEGSADGLVSNYTESVISDAEFNPLQAMTAGAILGGGMARANPHLVGKGTKAVTSQLGKHGITVGTNGAPQPGAPADAASTGPDRGPVNVDQDSPQPGAATDTSTAPGDGAGVDVPSDAPQPGAADGSGTSTDATPVDVPSGDGPSTDTPLTDGPAADAPQADVPHADSTPSESPHADAPPAETPHADSSQPDAPHSDVPQTDAPHADAPPADAPHADAPPADAPHADTPPADAPHTDTPPAETPHSDAPPAETAPVDGTQTDAPVLDASTIESPNADVPTIDASTVEAVQNDGATIDPSSGQPAGADPHAIDGANGDSAPHEPQTPREPNAAAPMSTGQTGGSNVHAADSVAPAADGPSHADGSAQPHSDADAAQADAAHTSESNGETSNSDSASDAQADGAEAADAGHAKSDSDTETQLSDADAAAVTGAAGVGAAAAVGLGGKLPGLHPGATGSSKLPNVSGAQNPHAADAAQADSNSNTEVSNADSASTDTDGTASNDATDSADAPATESNQDTTDSQNGSSTDADAQAKPQTIDDIKSWLPEVNPGFTGDATDPRSSNCGATTQAVFTRLNGGELSPAGLGTASIAEMEAFTGQPQTPMSPNQIRDALIAGGEGSHAVVGVDRANGQDGHWLNAYFDGTNVYAVDGQTGQISPWPPHLGDVTGWDAAVVAANPEAPAANNDAESSSPTSETGEVDSTGRSSADARDPRVKQPLSPEQNAILHGDAPSGDGWTRVETGPETVAEVQSYNSVKTSSGVMDPKYHPDLDMSPGQAALDIGYDVEAPYGRDSDGVPHDAQSWSSRYVNAAEPGEHYGVMDFAPNSGAQLNTRVQYSDLDAFVRDFGNLDLDRLGSVDGAFMGLGGGDFSDRALPPGQRSATELHNLTLRPDATLPDGWSIEVGRIAPAYGQDGGGLQVVVRDSEGNFQSVRESSLFDVQSSTSRTGASTPTTDAADTAPTSSKPGLETPDVGKKPNGWEDSQRVVTDPVTSDSGRTFAPEKVVRLNSIATLDSVNPELKGTTFNADTRYELDGGRYTFETDSKGRVVYAEGHIDHTVPTGTSNDYRVSNEQSKSGGPDRVTNGVHGDAGGHFFAAIFGGPGEGINMTAMNHQLLNIGKYRALERQWEAWVGDGTAGNSVHVQIRVDYPGDSIRPANYRVYHRRSDSTQWDYARLKNVLPTT